MQQHFLLQQSAVRRKCSQVSGVCSLVLVLDVRIASGSPNSSSFSFQVLSPCSSDAHLELALAKS